MFIRRHLFLPLLLLIFSACTYISGDKYPYSWQFLCSWEACPCELGAPPAADSAQQKKEIAGIIAKQAHMTADDKATVMAEDHIMPSMIITPVLGAQYTKATHPALFTLLEHAASDAWRISDNAQDYWGRTRPWLTDSRVQLLVSPIKRPSYPSGHSTTNHVWAHVLSELFPEKREALFKRAYQIGEHRVLAGVHYPSDVEAGKRLAATIYDAIRTDSDFKRELEAARAELAANPVAANDNTKLPKGKVTHCTTPEPGTSMTMCR